MFAVAALDYVWAFIILAAGILLMAGVVIRMDREGERSVAHERERPVGHEREPSAGRDLRRRLTLFLGASSAKGRPVTLIVVILLLALNVAVLLGHFNVW